jgi:hypothetical protein
LDPDELWDRFKIERYEGKIEVFLESLDVEEVDEDLAFGMISDIYDIAVKRGDYDRFTQLIEQLRQRRPKLYQHDAGYYLDYLIEFAVIAGELDEVPQYFMEFAENPTKNVDGFFRNIDLMMYHGMTESLLPALRKAQPKIESDPNIIGGEDIRAFIISLEIFKHIEERGPDSVDAAAVTRRLRVYTEDPDVEYYERVLRYLTGKGDRTWQKIDFSPDNEQRLDNLMFFLFDFLGYERWNKNIPFSRTEIARQEMLEYLKTEASHFLHPDKSSLDRYMGGRLGFLNPQYYRIGCMMEIIPDYFEFLQQKGLIDPEDARKRIAKIGILVPAVLRISDRDKIMISAIQRSWEPYQGLIPSKARKRKKGKKKRKKKKR